MPSSFIVFLKAMRSSPRSMASTWTPITFTPNLSRMPSLCSAEVRLSADCPPRLGRMASGRSFSMIRVIISTVSGSMYVMSAVPGSVMIVAGLEFTSTIS